ncbi:DUF2911 domain-containing protein [Flagellimonas meridianipacifica]|uniref:DUF2911 domain-containing protein n=1 Tax=Flagellimonas meridianipacifica TaxID=1080225 RepID=A0A2T0MB38_9FLAO|nr:DUF2911 domain-containing protein [Allomuricauda pacifica]PRX54720.1 Protein of unknown function (DUF2911) [Allomuricauda pacifica]
MKKCYSAISAIFFLAILFSSSSSIAQLNFLPRGSQTAKVMQRIGNTDVTIVYSRPSVNDREIWGALVPYGMNNLGFGTAKESPWRAGANENTIFKTSHDLSIDGKTLPAGKYGLHMIVNEDNTATVIFSNNYSAWGSYFYKPEEDVLRVDVSAKEIAHVEQLTYGFDSVDANSAMVSLNWEKKQIPFKIETDVTNNVLTEVRKQLQTTPGFARQSWEQAANFALNNDGDLDEALSWADAAIAGQFFSQKTFNNLNIKSQILAKQGKTTEAKALMEEALPLGTVFQVHGYGRQLIAQGKNDEALEIFKWNAKAHKGTWPVHYGLARGYSALGDNKSTLKHLKIAMENAPAQANKDRVAANIAKAEKGEGIN